MDRNRKFLERLTDFIKQMNSTNNKQKVLKKYEDLKNFVKYIFDKDNEFGVTSEDYKKFEESGKNQKGW